MSDHDWVEPSVLPDWSAITENVLAQARMRAVQMSEKADERRLFGSETDPVGALPMSKIEFMRTVGFDERYILMLNGWIEEQQEIVNQMGGMFLSELETCLNSLEQAKNTHTDESEED